MVTPERQVAIGRMIVVLSVAGIAAATLPPATYGAATRPFCIVCGQFGAVDAVLNVLLFVPLGVGMALAGARPGAAIGAAFAGTFTIELLQWQVIAGRDAGIGDVVTNTTGAVLGFVCGRRLPALVAPAPSTARILAGAWLLFWLALQAVVAYSLLPSLPEPPYYAQVDRPEGRSRVAFPGDVLSVTLGSEQLRTGPVPNAVLVRQLLVSDRGAPVRTTVVPGGVPARRAEIVALSGPRMEGIASLEQHARDVVFAIRTGADALRLRPYEYRLRDVFPARKAGAVTLEGHRQRGRVSVVAMDGARVTRREFAPRLSRGWMLLLPFSTYVDDDLGERLVGAVFLVTMIFPAGYWGGHAVRSSRDMPGRFAAIIALIVIAAAVFIMPLSFGLPMGDVFEFLWTVGGAAAGMGAAAVGSAWRRALPGDDGTAAPRTTKP